METVAVDDDPLTTRLGESGIVVQRVSDAMTPDSLQKAIRGADLSEVKRSNELVEHLISYEPSKVDPADLDAVIANPDAPYATAIKNLKIWRRHGRDLTSAQIPPSAYSSSPGEVKKFVELWNRYVGTWKRQTDAMTDVLAQGMRAKEPTTRFLRRIRVAIRRSDTDAYRSAVDRYTAELKRFADTIYGRDGRLQRLQNDGGSGETFAAIVEAANDSEDVSRLVETLRTKYPGSVFAKRLTR